MAYKIICSLSLMGRGAMRYQYILSIPFGGTDLPARTWPPNIGENLPLDLYTIHG